ncbi:MAG: TIGR04013 family B12-binding domain/radical SAM domain-containing protein [Candidatus Rifleibacteriota bacterium]
MSQNQPTLLFRLQNYNTVSFSALLGATPADQLAQFNLVFWNSSEELPIDRLSGRILYLHSFMLMHHPQISAEIAALRGNWPTMSFLAGGAQATADPARVLDSGFDHVFVGNAEVDFPLLLQKFAENRLEPGIHKQSVEDIDLDLFPGFSPLINYLPPLEITRGCRFGCMYCAVPRLCHGKVFHRSIEGILQILEAFYRFKTKRKRIKFLTPNAFGYGATDRQPNLEALQNLLKAIHDFGVPEIQFGSFPGEVRPDFVTREVMQIVKPYAVNRTIVMGVQTGSDAMLKKMNRGHTLDQAINAISLIREFGYTPHVDFIVGNPGETPDERVQLLDFMESMVKHYHIRIHMHAFMPIPGTPWAHMAQSYIEPDIHRRLRRLAAAGHLDGWWENQIGLGRFERQLGKNNCNLR